jgi:hypothetical protein
VTASLSSLGRDGRRHRVWTGDDAKNAREVSAHGEFVEVRLATQFLGPLSGARLILASDEGIWDGRLRP